MAGMPRGTWWGVGRKNRWTRKPYTTTTYLQYLWKGRYPYGCFNRYRSCHRGVDVGNVRGMPIYAWGRCVIRINGYDYGGYHRYVQVYFPDVNWSLTLGHLRNGSTYPAGTWFRKGQYMARVGTKREGINHPHVHFRAAPGDWRRCIPPCADYSPLTLWNKLN